MSYKFKKISANNYKYFVPRFVCISENFSKLTIFNKKINIL